MKSRIALPRPMLLACAIALSGGAGIAYAACTPDAYRGKRVVVIIPDGTRTAPIGAMFKALFARIGESTAAFDILDQLYNHPMTDIVLNQFLSDWAKVPK